MNRIIVICAMVTLLALSAGLVHGHKIVMNDGRIIRTPSCWEEGDILKYERYGGILSLKKDQIKEIIYEEEPVVSGEREGTALHTITEEQKALSETRTKGLSSRDIFRLCRPAVVIIRCGPAEGTGFIVSSKGYILTNYHVIRSDSPVKVWFAEGAEEYSATVISSTEKPDIALLKISKTELPYIAIEPGRVSERNIGEEVFAIGNPKGLRFSITRGIISQLRIIDDVRYIQTDTPINPGNSGGPLINKQGNVVGINTFKRAFSSGLNFAISSDYIHSWIRQYADSGVVETREAPEPERRERRRSGGGNVIIIPIPIPVD